MTVSTLSLDEALRELIKSIYHSRIVTQNQIARAAGINRSMLTAWLSGRRGITLKSASRLVNLLGLSTVGRYLEKIDTDAGRTRADELEIFERTRATLHQQVEDVNPRKDSNSNQKERCHETL